MNDKILSVSEFNNLINTIFFDLPDLVVEGEITTIKFSKKNAVFIDLKDCNDNALLKLSNFASWVKGINSIEEGMRVLVYGKPEIYSPRGSFSLKVVKIEPVGEGALKKAFEKLKKNLELQGFFEIERKRRIKAPIEKIALITAKNSAAYNDFVKILREYQVSVQIDFYPVLVQGRHAEEEISKCLQLINDKADKDYQAIVVIRGGGSLEDLKAFNSEEVAKQIYKSRIPIITGIGHEIDISIADLTADIYASTPSQAAFYIAEINQKYIENLFLNFENWSKLIMDSLIEKQKIFEFEKKLNNGFYKIQSKLINFKNILELFQVSLNLIDDEIQKKKDQIENFEKILYAYNPENVLKKGYCLLQSKDKYISDIKKLQIDDTIKIKLYNGEIDSKVVRKKVF